MYHISNLESENLNSNHKIPQKCAKITKWHFSDLISKKRKTKHKSPKPKETGSPSRWAKPGELAVWRVRAYIICSVMYIGGGIQTHTHSYRLGIGDTVELDQALSMARKTHGEHPPPTPAHLSQEREIRMTLSQHIETHSYTLEMKQWEFNQTLIMARKTHGENHPPPPNNPS